MRALVVDDSGVMRKVVIGALKRADILEVDQAEDGAQAVKSVEENDYGLIMMDWNMPIMNGFEALKKIRAMGKSVPIIIVTTEAEKSKILDAIKAGANNYIVKPFDPKTIIDKINETLEKAKA